MVTAYKSIDDIINETVVLLSLPPHERFRVQTLVFNWVTQFYTVKHQQFTKVINIDVPTDGQLWIDAPADMLDWIQLGIQHGDVIQPLDYNNKLSKIAANSKTLPRYGIAGNVLSGNFNDYYLPYYNGGWGYQRWSTQQYGIGYGEYNGQFSYDRANRRFIFAKPWPERESQVYLEYQYSPALATNYPVIEPLAAQALQTYIFWQYMLLKNDPRYREYKAQYQLDWNLYRANNARSVIQEILAAIRDNTHISIS